MCDEMQTVNVLPVVAHAEPTVLIHGGLEALSQPASPALVPVSLIDGAAAFELPLCFAGVDATAVDAALEEARATYDGETERSRK